MHSILTVYTSVSVSQFIPPSHSPLSVHIFVLQKNGTDEPICKAAAQGEIETQTCKEGIIFQSLE